MLLAQLNIALPVGPLDGPALVGFVENLESVNALADAAPGFVWRLQTEDGDATAIPTVDEAVARLDHLRAHGPTPRAFTFGRPFPAPDGQAVRTDDGWFCPA